MKKIAITGASGHLGNTLTRKLLEKGYELRVLVHNHLAPIKELNLGKVRGDILDPVCLRGLFDGVDIVFHLAGKISIDGDPDGSVMQVNVEGTKNVVDACIDCGVKRLIHFSSIHAFEQEPLDEDLDERRSTVADHGFVYGRSKSLSEKEVFKGMEKGLETIILNPTATLGPSDFKPSLMGQALIDLYNGKVPSIVPGGYNWVDARDVVDSSIAAIEKGRSGEKYLLSGTWITLKEFTETAEKITGKKAPKFSSPFWLAKLGLPFIGKLHSKFTKKPQLYTKESVSVLQHCNPKIKSKKAQAELGHSTRPLHDSIKDTYAWFFERGILK